MLFDRTVPVAKFVSFMDDAGFVVLGKQPKFSSVLYLHQCRQGLKVPEGSDF